MAGAPSDVPSLKELLDRLENVLVQEKAALLSGEYPGLESLIEEKSGLASLLDRALGDSKNNEQLPAYSRRIRKIAKAAQENEALLNGARAGAALASARVNDILTRQRNVGVYGESGEKLMAPDAGMTRWKLA